MERGNTKHGPRLDDEMNREVRGTVLGAAGSRTEEWQLAEPAGEDQPNPTVVPAGASRAGAPQGMTSEEVEERSRLGKFLDLSVFPTDRTGLHRNARKNDAPDDIIAELNQLPKDESYRTVSEVWAALGHSNESQRW